MDRTSGAVKDRKKEKGPSVAKHRHRWKLIHEHFEGFTNESGDMVFEVRWCSVCGGIKTQIVSDREPKCSYEPTEYPLWSRNH